MPVFTSTNRASKQNPSGKKMMFCPYCGTKLDDGARFCKNCGEAISGNDRGDRKFRHEEPLSGNPTERKTVYEGYLHKCPSCGEVLEAFTARCPACGWEVRGTTASNSLKELYRNIQTAKSDSEVVRLIKVFPVPNNKEDILEFMVLASSNFNEETYIEHMGEENISAAWFSKIEQCHKKATLSLSNEDMLKVNEIYSVITGRIAAAKKKSSQKRISQQSEVNAREFKESKFRVVLVVFSAISVLFSVLAFQNGRILAGLISALMVILFLTAFLMGSGVINERVRNFRLVPAILAFLLFVPYFSLSSNHDKQLLDASYYTNWEDIMLNKYVPEPIMTSAKVMTNSNERFYIYDVECSQSDYYDYVNACKEFGYNYEIIKEDETSFEAYNKDGYRIVVSYIISLTIEVNAPMKMSQIEWPNSNIAELIPQPKSLYGKIEWEHDYGFVIYIGNTTLSDYEEYVNSVYNNGFNIDYSKGDTYFWADNADGYHVSIDYEGFNTMFVRIDEPDEE